MSISLRVLLSFGLLGAVFIVVALQSPVIGIIGLGLAVVSAWMTVGSVAQPLAQVSAAMTAVAAGDLSKSVSGTARGDEIGTLARAVEALRNDVIATRNAAADHGHGDECCSSSTGGGSQRDALRSMASTVEGEAELAVADVSALTAELSEAAGRLNHVAMMTSESAADSAAASTETLTSAEVVAAATQELHASISEIASQIDTTRNVAHSAVVASQSAQDAMSGLSDATTRIGSVVQLINDIASQTNLLALNATIEAARAGEAGKGFAVVAGEVKALANQTAKATEEITGQIASIREVATKAVQAMSGITQTVTDVEVSTSAISAAVEEQSAATSEIARSVTQTAEAARKVSSLMDDLAKEAAQSRDLSDEVKKDGGRISETIAAFRQTLGRVIRTSSEDVNRRADNRFGVFVPCKAQAGGQMRDAIITNVSSGGICLMLDGHGAGVGQQVTVDSSEIGGSKSLRVVAAGKQFLHLSFGQSDRLAADFVARVAHKGAQALLHKAQSDHEAFVAGVMNVLAGKSPNRAADLANHHTCRLGKWYDGVSDANLLACPSFSALMDPHKRVHDAGKRAVAAHWAGKSSEADRAAEDLKRASQEVIALLGKLAQEAEHSAKAA